MNTMVIGFVDTTLKGNDMVAKVNEILEGIVNARAIGMVEFMDSEYVIMAEEGTDGNIELPYSSENLTNIYTYTRMILEVYGIMWVDSMNISLPITSLPDCLKHILYPLAIGGLGTVGIGGLETVGIDHKRRAYFTVEGMDTKFILI